MGKGSAFSKSEGVESVEPITGAMNVRKWLAKGNARVVKRVEVCLAAGLEAQVRDLDARIVAAKSAKVGVVDERLSSTGPDLVAMSREVEELRAEMQRSMTVFKFTGLDGERIQEILGQTPKGDNGEPDGEQVGYRIRAAQCIEPTGMTWEDMRDLAVAIGDQAFLNTINRAAEAAQSGVVDIPFSLAASQILATQTSSES